MAVYSIDKLIEETRRLAAEFRRSTGQSLPVSGEIARYDAARLLGLSLCEPRSGGVDAVGRGERDGRRIQVKGRVIFDEARGSARLGQLSPDGDWDTLLLLLMDSDYEPREIYEAGREEILDALTDKPNDKRTRRGAMSVAKFKAIGRLVWTAENGMEEEVWSNC